MSCEVVVVVVVGLWRGRGGGSWSGYLTYGPEMMKICGRSEKDEWLC